MLASLLELNQPFISLAPQDFFLPSSIHFMVYNQKKYLVLYIIMKRTAVNIQTGREREKKKRGKKNMTLWSVWQDKETGKSVCKFLSQCNIRNISSLTENIMYIWI